MRRSRRPLPAGSLALAWLLGSLPPCALAESGSDPAAVVEAAISSAESSLREGEREIAESRYRAALLEGWLLLGALDVAEGRLADAKEAFRRASSSAVEAQRAVRSLALVELQMGEASEAVTLFTRLLGRNPKDLQLRLLLARALAASGQPAQAVQELEEARTAAPDDPELVFALATGYLRLNKVEVAERLFDQIVKARPLPRTRVLIGRTYRDFGEYERARAALEAALRQDPRVRRAHYYLGTVLLLAERRGRLDEAIAEFQDELKLDPQDALASLYLGMALAEDRRYAEALPPLDRAIRSAHPQPDGFYYLGRCQLALDRPQEAAVTLGRALELLHGPEADDARVGNVHYQLALALRRLGAEQEAAAHFTEAEHRSAKQTESTRERLESYLSGSAEREAASGASAVPLDSPLAPLAPAQRLELRRRLAAALARAYLNLGVMQAQSQRFPRAAELLEAAAASDPEFPGLQHALGVAYFNAQQFAKATAPLTRALEANPEDASLKRMLALAWLDGEAYEKAADLLRDDPERERSPSLQYTYGLALVRSNRAADAEKIFSRLLAEHGDSPELNVVLGQAHAQQGDYDAAIQSLRRALERKADVAEANATLGVIYLKQGRLAEAEDALRAELKAHPDDLKSRHHLATVLDLSGRSEESLPLLRSVLKAKPDFADARYLLGKVLLARGAAQEAVEQLEAAARLAPEEANIRYQLAQAYQKLGRGELAQQQFELFRQLKDKRRGEAR